MGGLCTSRADPLPTSSKVISGTQIPEWVSAAGREIYESASDLAKSPYVPFTGQRIATYDGSKLTEAERQGQALTSAALVAFLFISPLCAASMALFSARVGQHLLLTLIAAPLIAAALPKVRLPRHLPASRRPGCPGA